VLAHTGRSSLAVHATRKIDDLLSELNDATEIATFENMPQDRIYTMLAEGASGGANELEFGLSQWGKVETPHTAFYGMVTGTEIAAWWKQYGERLFANNLRSVLGNTDVNKQIASTVDIRPEDFWYFNNGITVTAKDVIKSPAGGGTRDLGSFKASGAFVVNGAQTVSSLGRYDGNAENLENVRVPLRVISLEASKEDYGTLITRTNNTQNRIEARDFASQDPEQHRIRIELQIEGIEYNIARSDGFSRSDTAFDLEEATVALACAEGEANLAVQVKREISKFWVDLEKSPYKRLFNRSTSSFYVYQAVLLLRLVEKRIDEILKSLTRKSGKRYGVLVHGNRLIASVVFKRHQLPKQLGDIELCLEDHYAAISVLVDQAVDTLEEMVGIQYRDNFLAVVFKNPTKSKELFDMCVDGVRRKQVQLDLGL